MSAFQSDQVGDMLSAAGMDPRDWDLAELAEVLDAQWSQIESVRARLAQTDEPALRFNPRWE